MTGLAPAACRRQVVQRWHHYPLSGGTRAQEICTFPAPCPQNVSGHLCGASPFFCVLHEVVARRPNVECYSTVLDCYTHPCAWVRFQTPVRYGYYLQPQSQATKVGVNPTQRAKCMYGTRSRDKTSCAFTRDTLQKRVVLCPLRIGTAVETTLGARWVAVSVDILIAPIVVETVFALMYI